jgi:hypothetical protein
VRRGVGVRVEPRARLEQLKGRVDGQLLDQPRELLGLQVVDEDVGQEELAVQVALEAPGVHGARAPEDPVHLVQVALDDAHVRELLHLGGRGEVARAPVVALDLLELPPELGAELVEVEDDGVPRAVADEQLAVPVHDVAARARRDDPALVLEALLLVVDRAPEDLLVGEAAGEDEEKDGDDPVERDDPRVESGL